MDYLTRYHIIRVYDVNIESDPSVLAILREATQAEIRRAEGALGIKCVKVDEFRRGYGQTDDGRGYSYLQSRADCVRHVGKAG